MELLRKMFKYFSANHTKQFLDVLDLLVDQYNNAIHSSIKMTSKEAGREENKNNVWRNLYPEYLVVRPWLQNFRLMIMLE